MWTTFTDAERSGRVHPFTDGMAVWAWFLWLQSMHVTSPNPMFCTSYFIPTVLLVQIKQSFKIFSGKLGAVYAWLDILAKPMQIFNTDKMRVSVVQKPGKVVTEVGCQTVWSVTSAEIGKIHTVLSCVSASGVALPHFMYTSLLRRLAQMVCTSCAFQHIQHIFFRL